MAAPNKYDISRYNSVQNEGIYLRLGKITRVDYELKLADILLLDTSAQFTAIPINMTYEGTRGFLGAMPSENDLVIVSFAKSGDFKIPYIVSFLSHYYPYSVNFEKAGIENANEKRLKMKKLYPGEIYASSMCGSDLYLDKSVSLSNSLLNELSLRASDQSFNVNAVKQNLNFSGVYINSGAISRNDLIDELQDKLPLFYDIYGLPQYMPVYASPYNENFPYGKDTIDKHRPALMEHRVEIRETAEPRTMVTEGNSLVNIDKPYIKKGKDVDPPLLTLVLGNYVGSDSVSDDGKKNYGKLLKANLFNNINNFDYSLEEKPCIFDSTKNDFSSNAIAYCLKLNKTDTAFYINKEGKLITSIGASSSNDPMGAGESLELVTSGHIKAHLGKNKSNSKSLSLNTEGGIYTKFGFSNDSYSWKSIFDRAVQWDILGKNELNQSFILNVKGDVKETIEGSKITEIKGDKIQLIHGVLEDRVFGKKIDNFINDKSTNYGGSYIETIVNQYNQTIGQGRNVTIYGPNVTQGESVADKTDILLGDSELNLSLGDRKENLKLGNHELDILAGNKKISIKLGDFTVDITKGDIKISTSLGDIKLNSTAGNVVIQGNLGVTIQSAAKVEVKTPITKIGTGTQGGVVNDGPMGHRCYLTGAPHFGSKTVTCNSI